MTSLPANAEQFRHEWTSFHPTCPPLGWVLRTREGSPWVRFHALPESKRYAEHEAEREIILSRGNALGSKLLGIGQPCWMVEAEAGDASAPQDVAMAIVEGDDPEDVLWNFYARRERWEPSMNDAKLLAIADDGPRRALWMRRDNGAVFAPYDGGFDLFPASWQDVAELRAEQSEWLSSHPTGL